MPNYRTVFKDWKRSNYEMLQPFILVTNTAMTKLPRAGCNLIRPYTLPIDGVYTNHTADPTTEPVMHLSNTQAYKHMVTAFPE